MVVSVRPKTNVKLNSPSEPQQGIKRGRGLMMTDLILARQKRTLRAFPKKIVTQRQLEINLKTAFRLNSTAFISLDLNCLKMI
jgi:hypothetical protein